MLPVWCFYNIQYWWRQCLASSFWYKPLKRAFPGLGIQSFTHSRFTLAERMFKFQRLEASHKANICRVKQILVICSVWFLASSRHERGIWLPYHQISPRKGSIRGLTGGILLRLVLNTGNKCSLVSATHSHFYMEQWTDSLIGLSWHGCMGVLGTYMIQLSVGKNGLPFAT